LGQDLEVVLRDLLHDAEVGQGGEDGQQGLGQRRVHVAEEDPELLRRQDEEHLGWILFNHFRPKFTENTKVKFNFKIVTS
jgi:hypothetical protein